jgi:ribosomal protein L11 methylase PrmA
LDCLIRAAARLAERKADAVVGNLLARVGAQLRDHAAQVPQLVALANIFELLVDCCTLLLQEYQLARLH